MVCRERGDMVLQKIDLWQFIRFTVMFILTLAALADDIKRFKISNIIILLGLAAAVVLAGVEWSFGNSVRKYIMGGAIAFLLMIMAYIVHAIGAGDVKLVSALGFITGKPDIYTIIMWAFIYTAFLGGIATLCGKARLSKLNMKLHIIHFSGALLFAELYLMMALFWKGVYTR